MIYVVDSWLLFSFFDIHQASSGVPIFGSNVIFVELAIDLDKRVQYCFTLEFKRTHNGSDIHHLFSIDSKQLAAAFDW